MGAPAHFQSSFASDFFFTERKLKGTLVCESKQHQLDIVCRHYELIRRLLKKPENRPKDVLGPLVNCFNIVKSSKFIRV